MEEWRLNGLQYLQYSCIPEELNVSANHSTAVGSWKNEANNTVWRGHLNYFDYAMLLKMSFRKRWRQDLATDKVILSHSWVKW